jgi:hypothetical protein
MDSFLGNLRESSKIGIEVHKEIQRQFGMKKEREILGILKDENSLSRVLLEDLDLRLLGLFGRPDLYSQNDKYLFEIKPALQIQMGIAQIEWYLSTLNLYSKFNWRTGTYSDFHPETTLITESGAYVAISPISINGVITYLVIDRQVNETIAVTAGLAAMEIAKGMLQMQASAQAGEFAAIQARLSYFWMGGGL